MFVRQLIGSKAGEVIEMPYQAGLAARQNGTAREVEAFMDADGEMNYRDLGAGESAPAAAKGPRQDEAKPKRRGGWPLGKPRRPRAS